jgi:hypothetical protein
VINEAPDGSEKCKDQGGTFQHHSSFLAYSCRRRELINWSASSLPNAINEDLTVAPRSEPSLFATDYPHDGPGGRMTLKDVALLAAHPKISDGDKEKMRAQFSGQV